MKLVTRLSLLCTTLFTLGANAQVRLPQLVSDGMVLQRDAKINLWGWASPGEKLSVKFNGKTVRTAAGADGKWATALPAQKAGGPYTMQIDASNHITLKDVLIGDVWFCSGQSNMVVNMERVKEKYPQDIASANYSQIRNFFIPTISDVKSLHDDLPASHWVAASPKDVLTFGAASYFFARQLYLNYHIPIGIINSSVGGTPIQAWISESGIQSIPQYASRVGQFKDTVYLNKLLNPTKPVDNGKRNLQKPDKGMTESVKWFDSTYVAENWHKYWLPGYWADQGIRGLNGVVWFRKEVTVPASMIGKPAMLFMGRIIDADEAYVNGKLVGNTTYQYPPRRYVIPAGLLKAGKNIIVMRITNTSGKGGFVPDKNYSLTNGTENIDLRGDWTYKVGQVFVPSGNFNFNAFSAQNEPTGLYNTMVAPVLNYNIKGAVWYQGESNTGKPQEYAPMLKALIADWRAKWKQPNLPFVYAQLPNFGETQYSPTESQWAELRESQLMALSVPHTAMAVNYDAGEWNDIHPLNKKDVGERLALAARSVAYHDTKVVPMGPIYQSATVEGNRIIVTFNNIGSGLMAKGGGELNYFAIAGADKKFVWAKAAIEGNKVIVSSDDIPNPMYVRYAWADNPEGANLYNKEGLPASPFRTDKPGQ
ncbi:sialate O-acetylesterase [Mucilaginibacter galii]|uniref:9-O-acetylesterase n=1 Tax=Mucilaginibacter galii TaxID=2005073 RepID=A0A917J9V5_9SPHI|nr:sialate O-acetylesterase [Mucilaginibacter galii]GGI50625.1 9-O-acetylesterase [Mucilaginibacter galii]